MIENLNQHTVDRITTEYGKSSESWYLGFSGGKDSTALLKLTFRALEQAKKPKKPITVVYCDTGVEIPIVRSLVLRTLNGICREARELKLPITTKVVSPQLQDRYFVKVIGRGYPSPTNKFRWCTDRLRINPVQALFKMEKGKRHVILLGIRQGESPERDRTIARYRTDSDCFFRQSGSDNSLIFGPIINYDSDAVWETLLHTNSPRSIDAKKLLVLYRHANGECPIVRESKGPPCGKGRFGCWTCTVVRRDHAMENLVREDGYEELQPLLMFRNWLVAVRDDPAYRARHRRNGAKGLGPFTLEARREILSRLLETQSATRWSLLSRKELQAIKRLWAVDQRSETYSE